MASYSQTGFRVNYLVDLSTDDEEMGIKHIMIPESDEVSADGTSDRNYSGLVQCPILMNLEDKIPGNDRKSETFKQFDIVTDYSDHKFNGTILSDCNLLHEVIMDEWDNLKENLPKSIYVRVFEDQIQLLRAVIIGAPGTPYHDGLFVFDFLFPSDYPMSPPQAYFHSFGYGLNPNLPDDGEVRLGLLKTREAITSADYWYPHDSTMLHVLLSIQDLIFNAKPLCNDPAFDKASAVQIRAYNEGAFVLSCKTMVHLLKNPPMHIADLISDHFHRRKIPIMKAFDAYYRGVIEASQYYRIGRASSSTPQRIKVSENLKGLEVLVLVAKMMSYFDENDASLRARRAKKLNHTSSHEEGGGCGLINRISACLDSCFLAGERQHED